MVSTPGMGVSRREPGFVLLLNPQQDFRGIEGPFGQNHFKDFSHIAQSQVQRFWLPIEM
ncbi:MAG: hypothetical protein O7E52_15345 [Candidatus Poribacteria bacterium]|nr:hypothetical protein [Candidatus Poribacteria bacterium]